MNLNATEDDLLEWDLTIKDPDGNLPEISAGGLPEWLKMGPLTQESVRFTGAPGNGDHGPFSFTVTADDHKSMPVSRTFHGFVAAVNDSPTTVTPDPIVVDEDAVIPPLNLEDLFDDEEDGASGLDFRVEYYSGDPLLFQAVINGRQLKLVTHPDASGQGTVGVTARDTAGRHVTVQIPIIVRPINDPPYFFGVIPDITANANGEATVVSVRNWGHDPDIGDVLVWRIVGNSNPSLFQKLEFGGLGSLTMEYAPWISGWSSVTIEMEDAAGSSARATFTVILPEIPTPVITSGGAPVRNAQTGLWEQTVTVRNPGMRAIGGFEAAVIDLPAGTALYNSSRRAQGSPLVIYGQPLAAGGMATMILEYNAPDGVFLSPRFALTAIVPPGGQAASAKDLGVDLVLMSAEGTFQMEFIAVPGELYGVEYCEDGGEWTDSPPRVRAAGTRVWWADRASPPSTIAPGVAASRFYRVRHLVDP